MKLPHLPLVVFAALALLTPVGASDKKNKQEELESSVNFVVLKDDTGKPVRNASVVLHPVNKNGKQGKTGFELKTDADGKTHFDGVPYGVWLFQVIAPGFQTFGNNFDISQPAKDITIRLKRPQGQYSIYDQHDGTTATTAPK